MSHEVETMAYAGAVPWHGLGFKVSDDLSPQEMMQAAGCDWRVEKAPLSYTVDYNGGTILPVPNKWALVRSSDNSYFDTVGNGWEPLQNEDAFAFFKDFVAKGDMQMHTAGSLRGGKIVWALAKVADTFEPIKGDEIESYILLVNPHIRGKAIEARSTPIRVVCRNTMNFALSTTSSRRITVNHNQQWDEDYVKTMLGLAKESTALYAEKASFLARKFYNDATIDDFFADVFPHSDKESEEFSKNALRAHEVLSEQPGADLASGTWWNAFNAVTYMTDHEMGRNVDTRLNSAWFGQNRNRKELALQKAVEYAEAA
tara:strand:- start:681 stop:1625 length:945 start_codon:yes stop_codon:yes gene_type:complete